MGNGKWGMGNGEWGMGNGEWARVELFFFLLPSSFFPLPDIRYIRYIRRANPLPNFLLPSN